MIHILSVVFQIGNSNERPDEMFGCVWNITEVLYESTRYQIGLAQNILLYGLREIEEQISCFLNDV